MNKQLVKGKTKIFVLIIAFILVFKSIFGDENVLIAVTTVTAMLMFMERDLTTDLLKNTTFLVIFNLLMGIGGYVASNNIWLAVPINFIALFSIGYIFCYNLHNPLYLPFGLQYLFILATPVPHSSLGIRLISLVVGALLIMATQVVVNRNRISKSGNKLLGTVCYYICEKIKNVSNSISNFEVDKMIISSLASFKKIAYDKRSESFYFTEEATIKLNISAALEKIYVLLKKVDSSKENNEILKDIQSILEKFTDIFENKTNIKDIELYVKDMAGIYYNKSTDKEILSIFYNIKFIYDSLVTLDKIGVEKSNVIKKIDSIPSNYKRSDLAFEKPGAFSMRFKYSLRIGIGIALAAFITNYFELREGRWILFTIFSLITPIYEQSKQKAKDRIIGTILGVILVIVLFSVFQGTTSRTIIIMLNGYIASYFTLYRTKTISTTISAIGSVALLGGAEVISATRILYVLYGVIIAIILNRFLMPYRHEESQRDLRNMYNNVIREMLMLLYDSVNNNINNNEMKNLFTITTLIEEKIKSNSYMIMNTIEEKYILDKRTLIISIYELYLWISTKGVAEEDTHYVLEAIEDLSKYNSENIDNSILRVNEHIDKITNINDKVVLFSVLEILEELKEELAYA